uniref:Uncharacterized protein n=2 Tax=Ditylum brightwellii TaxID=49249 RepID=A0A6U3SC85_9STRA|mmetsp:Transcript_33931/g.50657  ORF Transcript_33931/g.50657 Transcript_33931/m.50657 type:complete len:165 (+) Transcript_33931:88-582(+)
MMMDDDRFLYYKSIPQTHSLPSVMPSSKVTISLKDDVFVIERYEDIMSDDEKATLWYTKEDKMRIQHSIKKTLKTMKKNTNSCNRCIRGLEHMRSREHLEQTKINMDCVRLGVLKEQQRQKVHGIFDPNELRYISSKASEWAKNKALEQGAINSMCWLELAVKN